MSHVTVDRDLLYNLAHRCMLLEIRNLQRKQQAIVDVSSDHFRQIEKDLLTTTRLKNELEKHLDSGDDAAALLAIRECLECLI